MVWPFESPFEEEIDVGARVRFVPRFVPDHEALLETLARTLPLRQETLRIVGQEHLVPRLTSYHGDPGTSYRYSGKTFEPEPFSSELDLLRRALLDFAPFNSVLVNLYRDGRDSMGPHSDAEPELGPSRDDIAVASISLGARRRFVLRARKGKARHEIELGEGDLFLMRGTTQRLFVHEVPKTKRVVGPRMNLTYRVVSRR